MKTLIYRLTLIHRKIDDEIRGAGRCRTADEHRCRKQSRAEIPDRREPSRLSRYG